MLCHSSVHLLQSSIDRVDVPCFIYPFVSWRAFELFPVWVILNKVAVHLRTGHCTDVFISLG